MKVVKIITITIGGILLILLLDYVRLNLSYRWNKSKYKETFLVQGNKNKYVPQGLTYSKKYNIILQTSYNSKHTVSMLYITDFKTGKRIKKLKLKEIDETDNVNHVGGITTDDNHVWITNNYEVNEYSLEEILTTTNDYIQSQKRDELPIRGDFCTYHEGLLWIGDFFLKPFYKVPEDNPLLMSFEVKDNMTYKTPTTVISLPKMVQGMVITPDHKFIFTHSYTNLIHSKLSMYDNVINKKTKETYSLNGQDIPYYHFNKQNLENTIKLPPMAEEFFYKDNQLYILFENSCDTYYYAIPKMKKIISLNIKEISKSK